jgi:hypothetical protein
MRAGHRWRLPVRRATGPPIHRPPKQESYLPVRLRRFVASPYSIFRDSSLSQRRKTQVDECHMNPALRFVHDSVPRDRGTHQGAHSFICVPRSSWRCSWPLWSGSSGCRWASSSCRCPNPSDSPQPRRPKCMARWLARERPRLRQARSTAREPPPRDAAEFEFEISS